MDAFTYDRAGHSLTADRPHSGATPDATQLFEYDAIGNTDFVIRRIAGDEDASGNPWHRGDRLY